MIGVAGSSFKDVKAFAPRLQPAIDYAQEMNDICVEKLGVTQAEIDATSSSEELRASENFYMKAVRQDQSWFASVHFLVIVESF